SLLRNEQMTLFAMLMVLVCVVVTHALYDGVRTLLDHLFYRGRFQRLRADLRKLSVEAGASRALPERLALILETLHQVLNYKQAFLAVREGDEYVIQATKGSAVSVPPLPLS